MRQREGTSFTSLGYFSVRTTYVFPLFFQEHFELQIALVHCPSSVAGCGVPVQNNLGHTAKPMRDMTGPSSLILYCTTILSPKRIGRERAGDMEGGREGGREGGEH